jgi:hypothetical protein
MIAIWTNEEPNIVMAWLTMKMKVFFFQLRPAVDGCITPCLLFGVCHRQIIASGAGLVF